MFEKLFIETNGINKDKVRDIVSYLERYVLHRESVSYMCDGSVIDFYAGDLDPKIITTDTITEIYKINGSEFDITFSWYPLAEPVVASYKCKKASETAKDNKSSNLN